MARIGIYAGTFDPVHVGHITFALQSIQAADLDAVYFVPERQPRVNMGVEHFGHRVAMLKKAVEPHPKLHVLELVDVNFTIERTLPALQQIYKDDQLVFMFGSDVAMHLSSWPNYKRLLEASELVVVLRYKDAKADLKATIEAWEAQPKAVTIFESFAPDVSSSAVRSALRQNRPGKGVLSSVERYSNRNWLYVSIVDRA